MITPEQLAKYFHLNVNIIRDQTEGLTYEDSLIQPPVRGNCLNWILGHILVSRDFIQAMFDRPTLLTEEQTALYKTGSQPITADIPDILTLEALLERLDRSQVVLNEELATITPEVLAEEIVVGQRTINKERRLFGLYFHDTYHTGQTELLRQLAGKDDKVI